MKAVELRCFPKDCWRKILITLTNHVGQFSKSEIAFHEKAGRSQVGSFCFSVDKVFLLPSYRCRHPSIRTLG